MTRALARRELASGHVAWVQVSEIADGDMAGESPVCRHLAPDSTAGASLTWLRQVHGSRVVVVNEPGGGRGAEADAAVTTKAGCVLSIRVADCAPVVLMAEGGGLAAIHAGWRGVRDGVLEVASATLRDMVPGPQSALIGPCIHPCCYEFDPVDLAALAGDLTPAVLGATRDGQPALDLPNAVMASLEKAGVSDFEVDGACTACDARYWSYRETGTTRRQAMIAALEPRRTADAR
ncbi:MAG: polyphenol oxidase family protein [Acidimicrobiia bacterium]|nr:polyphenol oxidase family protein [Actinomycetota bacterium]MBL6924057.1 polyphenol oxidase family protein [Acidimicrobiia bacterium]MBL6926559.1 polyphenol oxidase family protein [Acidimicrobiia bacterium]